MKKYFVYLMMALAAVTFNACSDDDPLQEEPGTEQPGTPDDPNDTPDDSGEPEDPNNPDTPAGDSNILVAYFSWGGTTQRMAQQIVAHTGADLFRIEPVTPYPELSHLIPKIIPNVQKWHWKNGTAMPVLP